MIVLYAGMVVMGAFVAYQFALLIYALWSLRDTPECQRAAWHLLAVMVVLALMALAWRVR